MKARKGGKNHGVNRERSYFARTKARLIKKHIAERVERGRILKRAFALFFAGEAIDMNEAKSLAFKNRRSTALKALEAA